MNRTDKGFVLMVVVVLFVILGFLYPLVILLPFLTFIAGMAVGGGFGIFQRIGGGLFKQFRNPPKTQTSKGTGKRARRHAKAK